MIDPTNDLLVALSHSAREAGARILDIVARGFDVERKDDRSPVTEADRAAEAVVLDALAVHAPKVPVIAEEQVAAGRVPAHDGTFFLVDALDGTREFIRGGSDYTVNIGLIVDRRPVLGIVYAPATGTLYEGIAGFGAWRTCDGARTDIAVRKRGPELLAVASRSHRTQATEDYLAGIGASDFVSVGSSLKFCLVAEGRADIYPRLGPTCEWDTAAGHAVLLGAGGQVDALDGSPLGYDKPAYFNPGFVATSGWRAPAAGPFLAETD